MRSGISTATTTTSSSGDIVSVGDQARRVGVLVLLACLAGCSGLVPAPSPTPAPPSPPVAASSAPASATPAAPASTPTDAPSGPPSMPADLALDLHGLSAAWSNRTGPTVANDGTELAWSVMDSASKGSDGHVPDIAAFTPGPRRAVCVPRVQLEAAGWRKRLAPLGTSSCQRQGRAARHAGRTAGRPSPRPFVRPHP